MFDISSYSKLKLWRKRKNEILQIKMGHLLKCISNSSSLVTCGSYALELEAVGNRLPLMIKFLVECRARGDKQNKAQETVKVSDLLLIIMPAFPSPVDPFT